MPATTSSGDSPSKLMTTANISSPKIIYFPTERNILRGVAKSRARHEFLAVEEYESWNALLRLNRTVLEQLDGALREQHGLTVTEFDVLITLFNAQGRRLG